MAQTPKKRKWGDDPAQPRVNLACERCRRRHIRCDGAPVCNNCEKTKSQCVYTEGDKKIVVSLKYIQSLQAEISRLRSKNDGGGSESDSKSLAGSDYNGSIVKGESNGDGSGNGAANGANVPLIPEMADVSDSLSSFNALDRSHVEATKSSATFEGSSSLSSFGLEIRDALPCGPHSKVDFSDRSIAPRDNKFVDIMVDRQGLRFHCKFVNAAVPDLDFELPTYDHTLRCLEIFKVYMSGCFYYLNIGQFKHRLFQTHYQDRTEPYTRADFLWYTQIFIMAAIGEMYLGIRPKRQCKRYPGLETFPGICAFDTATRLLSMTSDSTQLNDHQVVMIEVLLLYSFYLQLIRAESGYFIISGVCLKMSLGLGMHVNFCAYNKQLSQEEREHRRRLWWTIYNIDRFIAAKTGFPRSISDEDVLTIMPEDMSPDSSDPEMSEFGPAIYINSYTRIMQIYSSTVTELYKPGKKKDVLAIITEVMSQLVEWRKNLPNEVCVNWRVPDNELDVTRTLTNIYSEYHQCINLAVRPLLLAFVRKRIKDKKSGHAAVNPSQLPENVLTLLNASLDACIQSIRALKVLEGRNLFSTNGYLDREYTFYSASTLVMFNAAFSIHGSTNMYIDIAQELLGGIEVVVDKSKNIRLIQLRNFISAFDYLDAPGGHNQQSAESSHAVTTESGPALSAGPTAGSTNVPIVPSTVAPPTPQPTAISSVSDLSGIEPISHPSSHPPYAPYASSTTTATTAPTVATATPSQTRYYEVFNPGRAPTGVPWTINVIDNSSVDPVERALWDEISAESFWLDNISDEFKNLIEENN